MRIDLKALRDFQRHAFWRGYERVMIAANCYQNKKGDVLKFVRIEEDQSRYWYYDTKTKQQYWRPI